MASIGFHPGQRLAQPFRGLQPACPVECRAPEAPLSGLDVHHAGGGDLAQVATEAPAVQPFVGHQAPEAGRVYAVVAGRVYGGVPGECIAVSANGDPLEAGKGSR